MLGNLFPETVFGNIGGVSGAAALLLEGMYTGLLANHVFGAALNSYWFMYFLLPIPAILICFAAYNLGLHDVKFTSLFRTPYPESDRDPKKKK